MVVLSLISNVLLLLEEAAAAAAAEENPATYFPKGFSGLMSVKSVLNPVL